MAFAVALLAASCSQDELLEDDGTEEVPVTFTATVDYAIETQGDDTAGNMKQAATRATSTQDDAPTRFYAQAVSNGTLSKVVEGTKIGDNTYSFTLQVAKDTKSDYMFWADNADTEEPTDLRSVPYTMGDIAFAATAQGTPETVDENVKLQHVVAKVTLKTTTDVTSEYSKNISLTASCASMYNVQEASASSFEDKSVSIEMTDAGFVANSEVLTTYIIPNPENKTVTLDAHEMTQAISDVPLAANTNVTLQGDLSESSITALFKEITRSNSFQIPEIATFIQISNNLSAQLMYNNDLYISFNNDVEFCIYLIDYDPSCPDFSDIYPGTNIN